MINKNAFYVNKIYEIIFLHKDWKYFFIQKCRLKTKIRKSQYNWYHRILKDCSLGERKLKILLKNAVALRTLSILLNLMMAAVHLYMVLDRYWNEIEVLFLRIINKIKVNIKIVYPATSGLIKGFGDWKNNSIWSLLSQIIRARDVFLISANWSMKIEIWYHRNQN